MGKKPLAKPGRNNSWKHLPAERMGHGLAGSHGFAQIFIVLSVRFARLQRSCSDVLI
jgi:hypothetical protein